jgi:hypothetical protein
MYSVRAIVAERVGNATLLWNGWETDRHCSGAVSRPCFQTPDRVEASGFSCMFEAEDEAYCCYGRTTNEEDAKKTARGEHGAATGAEFENTA